MSDLEYDLMSTSDKSITPNQPSPKQYIKGGWLPHWSTYLCWKLSEVGIVYVFLSKEIITIFIVCSDVMKLLQIIQALVDIEKVESYYHPHFVLKVS